MATAEAERNPGYPQYDGFFFARRSFTPSPTKAGRWHGRYDFHTGYQGCLARGVEWSVRQAHVDRSSQMQKEISKPVRPHERQREYIATQIVAEYLRRYFGCDAVIYRSSMERDDHILRGLAAIFNLGRTASSRAASGATFSSSGLMLRLLDHAKRVFDAHPPDQYTQLRVDLRSPSPWARHPTPVAAKAGPVPTHERLGPDDCENLQDWWKPAIQLNKEKAIMVREPDATMQPSPQDNQLMSKHHVLGLKP
jgi:hypothetical protein